MESDLDMEVFVAAIKDGLVNTVSDEIQQKDTQPIIMEFGKRIAARNQATSARNRAASAKFFKENSEKEGVVTTASGLQYKEIIPSTERHYNAMKDGQDTEVRITYVARTLDGTVFDEANEPVKISINGVIPGLSEALKMIPLGAVWEVYIPSELAFGDHAPGFVEAGAAVIFRIKLHEILPRRAAPGNLIELTPDMMQQMEDAGLDSVL